MGDHIRKGLCNGRVRGLVIPRVCWHLTSHRVLATEWVYGIKVTEVPSAIKRRHIAIGVETYAAMILDLGLCHADPHPGNLLVTSEDCVCLLDYGMVIEVPPSHRWAWANCLVNLVRCDYDKVLDNLTDIGFFPEDCPRDVILPVMSRLWAEMVKCGSSTQKRKQVVRTCFDEIRILVTKFDFNLPDYYLALVRALLTLEGIALAADCEFDIFQATFPVAVRALASAPSQEGGGSMAMSLAAALVEQGADRLRSPGVALAVVVAATSLAVAFVAQRADAVL